MAVIADFSTSDGGVPVAPMATAFTYGDFGPRPAATVELGAWHIVLNAPAMTQAQYLGFGFYLEGNTPRTHCLDAGAYTGIRFTIHGTIAGTGCTFVYAVTDRAHESHAFDPRGVGDEASYAPQASVVVTTAHATVSMPFSGQGAPTGGSPAIGVDRTKLTRVQWQFSVPAGAPTGCAADLVIDDVAFY